MNIIDLYTKWGLKRLFRCAYKPSGNAIVERNHRTVKRMAERSNQSRSQDEMVYWYNLAPRGSSWDTAPAASVHTYKWRIPSVVEESTVNENAVGGIKMGDEVWGNQMIQNV